MLGWQHGMEGPNQRNVPKTPPGLPPKSQRQFLRRQLLHCPLRCQSPGAQGVPGPRRGATAASQVSTSQFTEPAGPQPHLTAWNVLLKPGPFLSSSPPALPLTLTVFPTLCSHDFPSDAIPVPVAHVPGGVTNEPAAPGRRGCSRGLWQGWGLGRPPLLPPAHLMLVRWQQGQPSDQRQERGKAFLASAQRGPSDTNSSHSRAGGPTPKALYAFGR